MNADRFDLPRWPSRRSRSGSRNRRGEIMARGLGSAQAGSRAGVAGVAGAEIANDLAQSLGEHPELGSPGDWSGARSGRCADRGCRTGAARASTPVPARTPASIAIPGTKVSPRPLSTICTSVWSDVPIIAALRGVRAGCRPTARGPSGNDRLRASAGAARRFRRRRRSRRLALRRRIGDEKRVVEQGAFYRHPRNRTGERAGHNRAGRDEARRRPRCWSPREGKA